MKAVPTKKIAVIGTIAIALLFAAGILFVAVATREGDAPAPRPPRPSSGSAWQLGSGPGARPTLAPGFEAPLPPGSPPAPGGPVPGAPGGAAPPGPGSDEAPGIRTYGGGGRLEAVDWDRKKPPRSAEDLE